jgi:hypothetical protein
LELFGEDGGDVFGDFGASVSVEDAGEEEVGGDLCGEVVILHVLSPAWDRGIGTLDGGTGDGDSHL